MVSVILEAVVFENHLGGLMPNWGRLTISFLVIFVRICVYGPLLQAYIFGKQIRFPSEELPAAEPDFDRL
jgi:hypothetical protein